MFLTPLLIQYLVDALGDINIGRSEAQCLAVLVHSFEFWLREPNELEGWDGEPEMRGSNLLDLNFLAVDPQFGSELVLQDIQFLASGDTPFEEFGAVLCGV